MSRTIETKHAVPQRYQQEAPSLDLKDASITPEAHSTSSRLQFYCDYREAIRELRDGRPEKFLAFQDDPRISPNMEELRAPMGMKASTAQAPTESNPFEHTKTLAVADSTFTSLLSSIKGLTTAITSFLK